MFYLYRACQSIRHLVPPNSCIQCLKFCRYPSHCLVAFVPSRRPGSPECHLPLLKNTWSHWVSSLSSMCLHFMNCVESWKIECTHCMAVLQLFLMEGRGGSAILHSYDQIRVCWKSPNVLPNAIRLRQESNLQPLGYLPTHCSNHWATEALVARVAIGRLNRQSFYFSADYMIIARTLTRGDPYRCNPICLLNPTTCLCHKQKHLLFERGWPGPAR